MGFRDIGKWISLAAKRAEIESLVSQAAKTGATADHEKLFASLPGYELFCNATKDSKASIFPSSQNSARVLITLGDTGCGLNNAIRFFVSNKRGSQLQVPYAGMTWQEALELLINEPLANGLIIVNSATAWVGINKQKARMLLDSLAAKDMP
jgi:hypothetical protein